MPVILDNGSDAIRTWLDPGRYSWSSELQALLKPYEGDLDVYPVSKEVGKVGNNSPSFIVPLASADNKRNIANFFASSTKAKAPKPEDDKENSTGGGGDGVEPETATPSLQSFPKDSRLKHEQGENRRTIKVEEGGENNAPMPVPKHEMQEVDDAGEDKARNPHKRSHVEFNDDDSDGGDGQYDGPESGQANKHAGKIARTGIADAAAAAASAASFSESHSTEASPMSPTAKTAGTPRKMRSATSNATSPKAKGKARMPAHDSQQRAITSFLGARDGGGGGGKRNGK